jgi:hypothetical protein
MMAQEMEEQRFQALQRVIVSEMLIEGGMKEDKGHTWGCLLSCALTKHPIEQYADALEHTQQNTRGNSHLESRFRTTLSKLRQQTGITIRAEIDALRAARHPPVMKPEMMLFQASSFWRYPLTAQSKVENMPPQTPKLPPVTGARAFMDDRAPTRRSP